MNNSMFANQARHQGTASLQASTPFSTSPDSPQDGPPSTDDKTSQLRHLMQGKDTVIIFFEKCTSAVNHHLDKKKYPEEWEDKLRTVFVNGLRSDIREAVELSGETKSYYIRKEAIFEEMFSSLNHLEDYRHDHRIHRIEMLHHCQYDKIKKIELKTNAMQHDIRGCREEVSNVKRILSEMLKLQKQQIAWESANSKKMIEVKEAVDLVNQQESEIMNGLGSVTEKLSVIEKSTSQLQKDLENQKTSSPSPKKQSPSAVKRPILPNPAEASSSRPFFHHSPPPPKISRLSTSPLEKVVSDDLKSFLKHEEYEMLLSDNVTLGVDKLYESYSRQVERYQKWMDQVSKPITFPCILCNRSGHHSYECPIVTRIADRQQRLRQLKEYCLVCGKHHKGECSAKLDCRICGKAKRDNMFVRGGTEHCRMMCPVQEEYHEIFQICNKLHDAKEYLQRA